MKLSDLRSDSWFAIALAIERGAHPKESELIAALRRQEPTIPGEAQIYLSRLLHGDVDRRGRPKNSEDHHMIRAEYLIRRVDRWARVYRARFKVPNPRKMAFAKVAEERGWKSGDIAKRNYGKAANLLSSSRIWSANWKLKKLARPKGHK